MGIVAVLMDMARAKRGIPTDTALGERLGVSRQAVSNWRHGDKFPDEDTIAHLADLAGEDAGQWLVAIKAVRTEGAAGKAWASLAKRLGAVAAALLCAIGLSIGGPAKAAPGKAFSVSAAPELRDECTLCHFKDTAGLCWESGGDPLHSDAGTAGLIPGGRTLQAGPEVAAR